MLNYYAYNVLYAERRQGRFPAWEGLRIVQERMKQTGGRTRARRIVPESSQSFCQLWTSGTDTGQNKSGLTCLEKGEIRPLLAFFGVPRTGFEPVLPA